MVGWDLEPRGIEMPHATARETAGPAASAGLLCRFGFWSAALTALFAAIALGVGVTTPPRSGPFAPSGSALTYPFASAARFVPRDFLWMYPGVLMMLGFLMLAACMHERSNGERRLLGMIGLCLAVTSFAVIAIDYFIQLQVVQPGLVAGEGADLALVSQYNPHGVFIALENLGFLVAAVSFLFLALSLGSSRLERATKWVLLAAFALAAGAFAGLWSYFGFDLGYRFEVAIIVIDWLTLIVVGVLMALVFRRGNDASDART
jgi:hypothetical protein